MKKPGPAGEPVFEGARGTGSADAGDWDFAGVNEKIAATARHVARPAAMRVVLGDAMAIPVVGQRE